MKTFIQVWSLIFLNIFVRATALQTLWMNHPWTSLSYVWNLWSYAFFQVGFAACLFRMKKTMNISEVI
jgi:hypothetical protein